MATRPNPRYLTILRRLQALTTYTYPTTTIINDHHPLNITTPTITQVYSTINNKIARKITHNSHHPTNRTTQLSTNNTTRTYEMYTTNKKLPSYNTNTKSTKHTT